MLRRVQELSGGEVALSLETFAAGAGTWRRSGEAIADDVYAACEAADAILLGAAGLPDARHPDGREAGGDVIFRLRFGLDLYSGIRPVRLYAGVPTPLRETAAGIDYVLVRENVEGLYAGRHGGSRVEGQVAADTSIVTRAGTRRIVETAFAVAERRAAAGRERSPIVTCVDKSNVLASYAFFREVASEVATRHVDVSFEAIYVDAAALYLVQRPRHSTSSSRKTCSATSSPTWAQARSAGSASRPPQTLGDGHGLFQAAHGSAPDIAGKGIANPAATILSAGMMLDWLGRRADDEAALRASRWIEEAVAATLRDGSGLTGDLGGSASTAEAGDAVLRALDAIAAAA